MWYILNWKYNLTVRKNKIEDIIIKLKNCTIDTKAAEESITDHKRQ